MFALLMQRRDLIRHDPAVDNRSECDRLTFIAGEQLAGGKRAEFREGRGLDRGGEPLTFGFRLR